MIVRQNSVEGIVSAPEFPELIDEYAREAANNELLPPQVKLEIYRAYENVGILHAFTAEQAGALIGFITLVVTTNPHYSIPVAVSESFFVTAPSRKSGAGLRLLEAAEGRARLLGSPGLYVSTPVDGQLETVLPRRGYRPSNTVYFKRLLHA